MTATALHEGAVLVTAGLARGRLRTHLSDLFVGSPIEFRARGAKDVSQPIGFEVHSEDARRVATAG